MLSRTCSLCLSFSTFIYKTLSFLLMILFTIGVFTRGWIDRLFQQSLFLNPGGFGRLSFSLASYAIAFLVDAHSYSSRRLYRKLRIAWRLQNDFRVEGKIRNFYLISFFNQVDRDFIVDNGPWSIQGSLLVVDR